MNSLLLLAAIVAAPASASGTLMDWRFFETRDGVYAVRTSDLERAEAEAYAPGSGGLGKAFAKAPAWVLSLSPDQPESPLRGKLRAAGVLKVYRPPQPGLKPLAVCLGDSECLNGADVSASACEATQCRDLRIERPSARRAGTRLTEQDLRRPLTLPSDAQGPTRLEPIGAHRQERPRVSVAGASARTEELGRALAGAWAGANPGPDGGHMHPEQPPRGPAAPGASEPASPVRHGAVSAERAAPAAGSDVPMAEGKVLAQALAVQAAQVRYRKSLPAGDRFVVVDERGNIVALTDDPETARRVAGSQYGVRRVPVSAPAKASVPPPLAGVKPARKPARRAPEPAAKADECLSARAIAGTLLSAAAAGAAGPCAVKQGQALISGARAAYAQASDESERAEQPVLLMP